MATGRRPYRMQRREARMEETRRRIARAAMELHEEVGPAKTTISAIARRAGVQRVTVYRHYPDEATLFRACSAHWAEEHPLPDLAAAMAAATPTERLYALLEALYVFYDDGAAMLRMVYRDAPEIPALGELVEENDRLIASAAEALLQTLALPEERLRLVRPALVHALAFPTWESLTRGGVRNSEAARMMAVAIEAIARDDGGGERGGRASPEDTSRTRGRESPSSTG